MPLQKVIFNRPTSDYGTTSRAFVKRSPLGKSQESENGLWQNRWGRAQTFLFGLGTALFALLFLVLRTQNDWLAESSGAQFFAFYSLIRKYGSVLPYSEALSIALGLAMFTGTAIGLVLGSTNPLGPAIARRALRRISRFEQVAHFFLLVGVISLPFLPLDKYEPSSSFDRNVAFILGNEVTAAVLVGANYAIYMVIWIALTTSIRTFWEK